MARLPIPGSDENTWGNVLNDFLTESLNTDGTIKSSAISAAIGDASSTAKGVVQLTGDLGGTAASPTVPGLADKADTTALTAHAADTTNIHGITDASVLETTAGSQAKVDTHVNDNSAAHAASAISFTAGGTIAGTDVQTAVAEVATDAASALSTHAADATIHSSGRELGYATATSSQGSITATGTAVNDLTNLSLTVTTTTRPAYLTGIVHVTHGTSGAGVSLMILPSSATGGGAALGALQIAWVTVPTASRQAEIYVEARIPPSTSDTYRLAASVTAGTGSTVATAIAPCIFKAVEA